MQKWYWPCRSEGWVEFKLLHQTVAYRTVCGQPAAYWVPLFHDITLLYEVSMPFQGPPPPNNKSCVIHLISYSYWWCFCKKALSAKNKREKKKKTMKASVAFFKSGHFVCLDENISGRVSLLLHVQWFYSSPFINQELENFNNGKLSSWIHKTDEVVLGRKKNSYT